MITEPGIYTDITEADYLADPVEGGSLSSTGARAILRSPAHYRASIDQPTHSDNFDFGTAAHRLVTGNGSGVVVIDADSWRKKATQEQRDEARDNGLTPLLRHDWETVEAMAEPLRSHPVARAILERDGTTETTVVWHDRVWRRCRIDLFPTIEAADSRVVFADYKTAVDADTASFEKAVANYGYHQQDAFYRDGVTAVTGLPAVMLFIVQEKTQPYAVNVVELSGAAVDVGRERNERAVDIYERCREADVWPGYGDQINRAALPVWAIRQHEEEYAEWHQTPQS